MITKLYCVCLSMVVFLVIGNAHAMVAHVEKLAGAEPEECYNGLGERVDPEIADPFTCPDTEVPFHPDYALPYTPQTYVWSLTQHEFSLWFGTGANILCTTQGAFYSEVAVDANGSSICEFGESPMIDQYPLLPDVYGDWRPPRIYRYDLNTGQLIDRTPYSDPSIYICLGLRSAGSHNGVVFLAGGTFNQGIVMFAYDAVTGVYLGSQTFPGYRTLRKWKVIQGQLYTGVGTTATEYYSGRVLRWTGSVTDPFNFDEVGNLPNITGINEPVYGGVVRELTEYIDGTGQSRIAVTASGVWLSPPIPPGGFTNTDYGNWARIWSPAQYEPDYVTRQTYVGGGIEFLNGWLYFMTMHIPGNAADVHANCALPPLNIPFPSEYCFGETRTFAERQAVSNGTFRATTLWRIKNAESGITRVTQLLYGEPELPQYTEGLYDPEDPRSSPSDAFPMVSTGYTPLLGAAGFNNDCNNYGWVMQAVGNQLFAGTMDYCTLSNPSTSSAGADLWRIDGTAGDVPMAAVPETTNAFKDFNNPGNPDIYHHSPYGFRTLIKSADGTKLFAGMATGVNVGAVGDGAGWQLLQLDLEADPPPFCAWDIEPEGSHDSDVDGLDLDAAAIMALSPAQLEAFARDFGDPSCQ